MNPGIGLPPAPLLQNAGIKAWKAEKQHGISKRELKGNIHVLHAPPTTEAMNLKKRIESLRT